MAELTVKIHMTKESLDHFWNQLIKESKRLGFEVERRELVEISEELMLDERTHANIYSTTIAGIQVCATAFQVNEAFQKQQS